MVGDETYEIAVSTQHFGDIATGWDIVRTVAGDVGKALTCEGKRGFVLL